MALLEMTETLAERCFAAVYRFAVDGNEQKGKVAAKPAVSNFIDRIA
jgi:hypothetical protein